MEHPGWRPRSAWLERQTPPAPAAGAEAMTLRQRSHQMKCAPATNGLGASGRYGLALCMQQLPRSVPLWSPSLMSGEGQSTWPGIVRLRLPADAWHVAEESPGAPRALTVVVDRESAVSRGYPRSLTSPAKAPQTGSPQGAMMPAVVPCGEMLSRALRKTSVAFRQAV